MPGAKSCSDKFFSLSGGKSGFGRILEKRVGWEVE